MRTKKAFALTMALAMAALTALTGCGGSGNSGSSAESTGTDSGKTYKVGIVQYVDDASLNQIESNIEAELDSKGEELGVTFNYADYTFNGQADASTMNQIATELIADKVDVIIPIATPVALVMQSATADSQIPVVFSAISDPVGAGVVESMEAPGANITGVSDALDTEAVLNLMITANPEIQKVGLLYDKSQDSSISSIENAKKFLDEKGIAYEEKTGTTNDEVSLGADALIADEVEAVFTPTDNTIMTAELAIYEKFIKAGIPHYAGADSFALNGAFCGYGVNYQEVGKETADMVVDVLVNGADPATTPVKTLNNGIATVNIETAEAIGIDYSAFAGMCEDVIETVTKQEFDD